MKTDMIGKTLDLVPYEDKSDSNNKVFDLSPQNDFDIARQNIKDIITKTTPALESAIDVAISSQDYRDYTALSTLTKSLIDANKMLLDLAKTDKEVEKLTLDNEIKKKIKTSNSEVTDLGTVINNNNLYVTSSELLKRIRELSKKENEDDK